MGDIVYKEESYSISGAIFEVYKELGSGFLEAVYQECLSKEFSRQKIPFTAQPELTIWYKDEPISQTYKPDFICYDKIIIELKAVTELSPIHRAQVLNYLKISKMKLGILVNFCSYPKVQLERLTL
ncbi:MAG TPA: GxxExxY protein [Candidatus Cloacimonadota bacterium]|nr:GxxExxY protein [Candidatus Cloacimonadota bacterium]